MPEAQKTKKVQGPRVQKVPEQKLRGVSLTSTSQPQKTVKVVECRWEHSTCKNIGIRSDDSIIIVSETLGEVSVSKSNRKQ